jgi:uncharacterized protein involved in exopolysaccharide biosynthesis
MNVSSSSVPVQEIDLLQMWRTIIARPRLLAVGTATGLALSVAFALLSPPIYRADILIVPVASETGSLGSLGSLGGLAALAGVSGGAGSEKQVEAKATLESRALAEIVIQELDLMPILFADKWDPQAKRWTAKDGEKTPSLWDATQYFLHKVRKIEPDAKSGLLSVQVEWTDPKLAAEWATALVQESNRLLSHRAIERSQRNIAYLQSQLDKTSVIEIRQAIFKLLEDEIKTTMLAQGGDEYAFKVVDPAVVPESKVKPMRALIVVIGTFASAVLAALLALMLGVKRAD